MPFGKFHPQQAVAKGSGGGRNIFLVWVELGLTGSWQSYQIKNEAAGTFEQVKLLVAISGGVDSTALLLSLNELSTKLKFSVHAAHINHGLRGAESQADEDFCRQLCADLQVPFSVGKLEPAAVHNSESGWREARYGLLQQLARHTGCRAIVTGHTVDDQVETVLFRLFRGTALGGLRGIPDMRELDGQLVLLRPLLDLSKAQCLTYLQEKQQSAREDTSNANPQFARNYIRQCLVPAINQRFSGFIQRVEQTRRVLRSEDDYLDQLTLEHLNDLLAKTGKDKQYWIIQKFARFPLAIKRRLIAMYLQERHIEKSFQLIDEILCLCDVGIPSAISLNAKWDVRVAGQYIQWLDKSKKKMVLDFVPFEQTVKLPGLTMLLSRQRALKIEPFTLDSFLPERFPAAKSLEVLVDLSAISEPLTVRTRQAGDFIQPFGMQQPVKLKKYLHTHQVPANADSPLLMLCAGPEVLWIPSVGLSNRLRVSKRPTHQLSWLKLKDDVGSLC